MAITINKPTHPFPIILNLVVKQKSVEPIAISEKALVSPWKDKQNPTPDDEI